MPESTGRARVAVLPLTRRVCLHHTLIRSGEPVGCGLRKSPPVRSLNTGGCRGEVREMTALPLTLMTLPILRIDCWLDRDKGRASLFAATHRFGDDASHGCSELCSTVGRGTFESVKQREESRPTAPMQRRPTSFDDSERNSRGWIETKPDASSRLFAASQGLRSAIWRGAGCPPMASAGSPNRSSLMQCPAVGDASPVLPIISRDG